MAVDGWLGQDELMHSLLVIYLSRTYSWQLHEGMPETFCPMVSSSLAFVDLHP
jgi:hypothetical protein